MANDVSLAISVEGMDEIDRQLSRLAIEARGKALNKAMRRATKLGQANARKRAPDSSGIGGDPDFPDLSESIATKVIEKGEAVIGIVGTTPKARQAHLTEFGHLMVLGGTISSGDPARTRKAVNPENTGQGRVVGYVTPSPWFRPSYDETAPQIEPIFLDELAKVVDAIA